MNLSQFLLTMRARYKIILLTLGVTVAATIVISLLLPKTYIGTAALVVNYKGVDSVTGLAMPAQLMPGYVATQVDIIKSKNVALKVVDTLKLADSAEVQQQFNTATGGEGTVRDWLADLLLDKVDVVPARESSVLSITFKGNEPRFVALVANAFTNAYLQFSVQLKTAPAQLASGYITTQTKLLRERYEQAQGNLSKYQTENNIYSADNRLDVETVRLNELSSQLVQVQGLAMEASSRQRQAQGNAGASPDVQNNSLIQSLKSSLALAESRFADVSARLAANHPQYLSTKSEVDKLRASLNEQISSASAGVVGNARIYQQREAELRAALAAQKTKVQALNGARDEFNVLSNEVENARHAYEAASQRFSVTSLESQSNQADVGVLAEATPPLRPAGPKLLLNIALSLVVGTLLGVGAALGMELRKPRVRSVAQLVETFGLPVLGVIEKSRALPHKSGQRALPPAGGGPTNTASA